MIIFSGVAILISSGIFRLPGHLPFNPRRRAGLSPNTAVGWGYARVEQAGIERAESSEGRTCPVEKPVTFAAGRDAPAAESALGWPASSASGAVLRRCRR